MGKMNRVLITGVGGYIGHQLAAYIKVNSPHTIINGIDIDRDLVVDLLVNRHLDAFQDDCFYLNGENDTSVEYDCVFHLAATSSVPAFDINPLQGFYNTIEACRLLENVRFKKLIHASSASLQTVEEPNWYILSKNTAETILNKAYGKKVWNLRLHNVAGRNPKFSYVERHDPETHLIPSLVKNQILKVYGDGSNRRTYVHVTDVCTCMWDVALYAKPHEFDKENWPYEIGPPKSYSVIDVIREYQGVSGAGLGIEFHPARSEPAHQQSNYDYFAAKTPKGHEWKSLREMIEDTMKGNP